MKEYKKERVKVNCVECGKERYILAQNLKQVKRCVYCQSIKNQEMNTDLVRKRRRAKQEEKKNLTEPKDKILNFG